jgi:protein translocase SecG subunit
MDTIDVVFRIVLAVISIFTVVIVLMQSDKGDGGFSSTFAGGQSNLQRSGKIKRSESRLVLFTKIGCVLLIMLSIGLVLYSRFVV